MTDPWKAIYCQSDKCAKLLLDTNGKALAEYKVYPDVDNEAVVQFTCPRCGQVETWGVTRQKVAKTLYERFQHA
jgi:phage FluMu protein Com